MVSHSVVVTPRAQESIRRIVDRLRATISDQTASHVLKGINNAIRSLALLPESHEVEHLISDEIIEYRRILKWNYRIIFTVDKDEIMVLVVDVVSSQQSPETLKKKFGK